jgi:hypothetical protein
MMDEQGRIPRIGRILQREIPPVPWAIAGLSPLRILIEAA